MVLGSGKVVAAQETGISQKIRATFLGAPSDKD